MNSFSSSITSGQAAGDRRGSNRIWIFGLALLTFLVHAPGIFSGFVFDDTFTIEHRGGAEWSHLPRFFTTDQSAFFGSNFYRPVLSVWYELSYSLFGTHAAAWHLASILLHIVCTVLVFALALTLVRNRAVAFAAAALFGMHPAQVEVISWASAMGDPLMTAFMLLSALAFLRWMEQGKPTWLAVSLVAGIACVFTKETAVVLPVVLFATALAYRSHARPGLPVFAATIPFFAISLVYVGIRQTVLGSFSHPLNPASTVQMILTWPSAGLFYLRHMFWPSVVVPYYPLRMVQNWNSTEFVAPLVGLTAATVGLGYLLWRAGGWQNLCICATWILVPLAPALYLKAQAPYELVHDRFLYAPLVGFCIAAALVLKWAAEPMEARVQRPVFPLLAVALVTLLSIETMSQMVWWQNNRTLFTRAVTITPDNPRALVNLANTYIAERRYQEALPLLQRAIANDPHYGLGLFALGRIAWVMGDDLSAEKYFTQAVNSQPRYDMWLHLASVELHMSRVDAAEFAARQSIAMNPSGLGAHAVLGTVLLAKGDSAGAAREFREELRFFPQSEPAQLGLAQAMRTPR